MTFPMSMEPRVSPRLVLPRLHLHVDICFRRGHMVVGSNQSELEGSPCGGADGHSALLLY